MTTYTAWRGEYGPPTDLSPQSRLSSLSFVSEPGIAVHYATSPNNVHDTPNESRVFQVRFEINRPAINTPGDGFVDYDVWVRCVGEANAKESLRRIEDHIYNTNIWETYSPDYARVHDLIERAPGELTNLYLQIWALLDDPWVVEVLQSFDYDGAIFRGSGISAFAVEYRVFGPVVILSTTPA